MASPWMTVTCCSTSVINCFMTVGNKLYDIGIVPLQKYVQALPVSLKKFISEHL